jgi:hypothetical protein
MEQLAHELAVSRATLYRAIDGRDRSRVIEEQRTWLKNAESGAPVGQSGHRRRDASRCRSYLGLT